MDTKQSELSGAGDGEGPEDHRSPAEIRRDIQRTRADLDRTVGVLGERLQPKRLAWEARRRLEPELREAGRNLGRKAKGIPKTLLVAGGAVLGLLLLRKLHRRRGREFPDEQRGL